MKILIKRENNNYEITLQHNAMETKIISKERPSFQMIKYFIRRMLFWNISNMKKGHIKIIK